ncbi:MAG: GDP-mannose 4,6-dehydratase [Holosporales bacterium]|jgi:dTDP-glucose 4,6-dehydratase|nr:GDP-mannose 4,6-dehydratase [Holosporales bacterium]
MPSYAIIGGGAFLAVHFAKYLLAQTSTEKVISIGRNPQRSEAFTLGVGRGDSRYAYEQAHIVFEPERLFKLLDRFNPEYIVNFAALPYTGTFVGSFHHYNTNVVALSRLCEHLAECSCFKKLLHISTSALYGSVNHPASEEYPVNPTSPYAISKLAADLHLKILWLAKKFPMNILRPSNVYGPGQQLCQLLPKAVYCGLIGKKVPLEGGLAKRSYMHAYDFAKAIFLILHNADFGEVFNIGPDNPVTIRHLVELVARGINLEFEDIANILPGRVGEDAVYWLDSSKIKSRLGYKETVSLEQGIDDMINWGRKYLDLLYDEPCKFVPTA